MTYVHIRHVRAAGICCRGAREWFGRQEGLTWAEFLDRGYPVEAIRARGCAIADRAANKAEEEAANGR
jgi:hypothetical protein